MRFYKGQIWGVLPNRDICGCNRARILATNSGMGIGLAKNISPVEVSLDSSSLLISEVRKTTGMLCNAG